MKKVLTFTAVLVVAAIAFSSCKKDTPPITVTSCFEDTYNGTYTGDLVVGVSNSTSSIKITKISCTSAKLESSAFTTITVNSLNASAAGSFSGTTDANQSIALVLSSNSAQISGPIAFNGTR